MLPVEQGGKGDYMIKLRTDDYGNSDPRRALIPYPLALKMYEVILNG